MKLISNPNIPTRPKWESRTIHAAGELAGNPSETKRTRSQFESALSVKDPFFVEKCYFIFEQENQTYEDELYDPT